MEWQRTNRVSLVEQAALQMEQRIEKGDWQVGDKIPSEPELAEALGVSRNTLREAVRALVHAGLLEAKPGDGTYVMQASVLGAALAKRFQTLPNEEILTTRHMIERESARLAALHHTAEDLAKLYQLLAQRDQAASFDAFVEADLAFHQGVVRASHQTLFIELYDYIAEHTLTTIASTSRADREPASTNELHKQLVQAIEASDSERTAAIVDAYIKHFHEHTHDER
ncbi:FadR family transcriptional regulator [Bacillaceae bacterium SIJ1]|uniref:FadR/GntR family transcriptional regulator n=1 Tax=Litoribacterium kuwaitense TaxID=1398745 RepID=UPI0013EC2268|nr:FadR/GntR family transcriptional regulator [Litoribacterium kuwaitense]NGP45282.1 FadR family transcriptional regulator [Litoribacterium kuwaitense]